MITPDEVAKVIEEDIDDPFDLEPIQDGVNSTFAITTDSREYVAKFGTFDPHSVRVEPHLLNRFDEQNLPVPVVRSIGQYKATPYFVMDRVSGKQLPYPQELSDDTLVDVTPEIGALLGQIQHIECGIGQLRVHDDTLETGNEDWQSFYRRMLDQFRQQAAGNYPSLSQRATKLIDRLNVPEIDRTVLCPLDFHTRNIFLSGQGDISAVIDFERVYGGDPGWGFAVTLHTLRAGRSEKVRAEVEQKLESGYDRVQDTVPKRHPAFDLLAVLREMRAAHFWWDDPADHRDRLEAEIRDLETRISEASE